MVSYINHQGRQGANLEIQWVHDSNHGFLSYVWTNQTLDKLTRQNRPRVAFRLVATRDIASDEEVFLDYGDSWEQAWEEHVRSWTPSYDVVHPDELREWNRRARNGRVGSLPTTFDRVRPSNSKAESNDRDGPPRQSHLECRRDNIDEDASESFFALQDYWPCEILYESVAHQDSNETLYTVEAHVAESSQIWQVGLRQLRWAAGPYTSVLHAKKAFRHDIGIPDELFPMQWRNWKSHSL